MIVQLDPAQHVSACESSSIGPVSILEFSYRVTLANDLVFWHGNRGEVLMVETTKAGCQPRWAALPPKGAVDVDVDVC